MVVRHLDPGPGMHYFSVRSSSNKFGVHRAFLWQLDLWMTFDLWLGRFENMLSNYVGPSPNFVPVA